MLASDLEVSWNIVMPAYVQRSAEDEVGARGGAATMVVVTMSSRWRASGLELLRRFASPDTGQMSSGHQDQVRLEASHGLGGARANPCRSASASMPSTSARGTSSPTP